MEEHFRRFLRETTFQGYKQVIETHMIPELGDVRLAKLRADQINHLPAKSLEAGLSDRFVEYIHGILKRSLNVALKWGLITRKPVTLVTPPKVRFQVPKTWRADQVKTFLETIKDDRWAAIYYLGCGTGMRKGEVLGM